MSFIYRHGRIIMPLLLVVAFGLAVPVSAQSPSPSPDPAAAKDLGPRDAISQKADEARQAGRLDEAITLYQQAVKTRTEWLEGWWYLATLLYERDRYVEAKGAFQKAIELDPKRGAPVAMLGLCEFELKDYEQSLSHLEQGRVLGIGDNIELGSVVHYHDGILLTHFGKFREANQALTYLAHYQNASPKVLEALGLDVLEMPLFPGQTPPDKLDLVMKVGHAIFCTVARRPAEAKDAFEELLAKYPTVPKLHYFYGVFLITEQSDAAIEQFKRELEISPKDVYSVLRLANEYINRADYTNAQPYAEKAVQLAEGEAAPHIALGRILVETGKIDEGINELELAERFDDSSSKVHFALAHAYGRAGRKDDAKRERELFLQLDAKERAQWGHSDGPADPISPGEAPNSKPSDKPEK
ncbi:MAG TPA: tetratricopeptide repeat protein [Blastocatellia bacterium]